MTTPTPQQWTDETEDLVAAALYGKAGDFATAPGPTRGGFLAYAQRALAVLADRGLLHDESNYGECRPDCDCGDHQGPRSCGCHVTGAEARDWIRELEAEADAMRPVVEAAKAWAELAVENCGIPTVLVGYERALLAAVDTYTTHPED